MWSGYVLLDIHLQIVIVEVDDSNLTPKSFIEYKNLSDK